MKLKGSCGNEISTAFHLSFQHFFWQNLSCQDRFSIYHSSLYLTPGNSNSYFCHLDFVVNFVAVVAVVNFVGVALILIAV